MKSLILLLLLPLTLYSADIDTKLFDGNNTEAYYDNVSKLIDQEDTPEQTDIERVATERMILSKLKKMISFTPQVSPLPESLLPDDQNISMDNYLSYLNALTDSSMKIDALKKEQDSIQSKRESLKDSIANITAEDKKNLLLYQLQYAFYKLKDKNNALTIKAYEESIDKGVKRFEKTLPQVHFNVPALTKELKDLSKKRSKLEDDSVALKLAKERELMHSDSVSKTLEKKLQVNATEISENITTMTDRKILLSLASLQKGQTQQTVDLFSEIKNDISFLPEELKTYYTFKSKLLKNVFKDIAGNVALAISNVGQSAESLYEFTYTKLTEPLFVFNERGISVVDILIFLFILILGFMIASVYKRKIMNLATKEKLSVSSAKMISSAGYYFLVFITLIIALNSIGLDLSNLGIIAGALSIGVGFGLQTLVSNLAAGIIMMFERTIRLGDYIEISDTIRGTVSDMKMRSTTVTTNDNIDVIIPNSSFVQNNVINWTLENDIRRIHIPFSVAYGTPNEMVEEVILEELKDSGINFVSKIAKYSPSIWMTAMGASSVDYELIVWIRGSLTTKPSGTKSDFLKFIYATLNKHNIEIPFPQLDLHVKDNNEKIKVTND